MNRMNQGKNQRRQSSQKDAKRRQTQSERANVSMDEDDDKPAERGDRQRRSA